MNVAVIVPTCREDQIKKFKLAWKKQLELHEAKLIIVHDGDEPWIEADHNFTVASLMGEDLSLISSHTSAVRNAGTAYAALVGFEVLFTVDDDCKPIGDTIGDHLKALYQRVPISWMPIGTQYTRGFPYEIRQEAPVMLSHGVWQGIYDYDAPSQFFRGYPDMEFYEMTIPKGCYAPISGMNLAFKREAVPYMYFAPREDGIARHDDIFMGIVAKREFDKRNWAMVTGYATVEHQKMSSVYANLQKESLGLMLNEVFWQGDENHPYFRRYKEKRKRWEKFIKKLN